jgi:hypothetical protein
VTEPLFEVELQAFAPTVLDPIDALMRGFGVSAARAETIVTRLPAVVKRRAAAREALRYARALVALGASVVVRRESSHHEVSLDELSGAERPPSGAIASADPAARLGRLPRAAFRSGRHPALVLPPTGALTADNPLESPLVTLEEPLPAHRLPAPEAPAERPAPERRSGELELDAAALPAGRHGATVPAIPEVLAQIRDFERTSWEPLHPTLGLDLGQPQPPHDASGSRPRIPTGALPRPGPGPRHTQTGRAVDRSASQERPKARLPRLGTTRLVLAGLGALALVAALFVATRLLGGVPAELEAALRTLGQAYLPGFEMKDAASGRLGSADPDERPVAVRLGRCHGWIATTRDSPCDLDLALFDGSTLLASDVLADNVPVVFHCSDRDRTLTLRLANVSPQKCRYGLATFEGPGSIGSPLEPYLDLYARYLSAKRGGAPFEAVGGIGHGTLATTDIARDVLHLPSGRCLNVLAVVQQGSDLDLRLWLDGRVVAEDAAADNFPIVGHCAGEADLELTVEFEMYSGGGPYVHQLLEGRPLQLGR